MADNLLYYGDNLDILRKRLKRDTVDLCYIDPPFNSKRNYNQIYNNIGTEDRAQAQAFTDTWRWDDRAIKGRDEILSNAEGRFQPRLVELIKGLHGVLGEGSMLAYLVSMSLRITEIHRVLKPTGSFFLHCDPTAGHYLKLVLDAVFLSQGGDFRNEIVWCYTGPGSPGMRQFMRKHDTIFWYSKGSTWTFNADAVRIPHSAKTKANYKEGLIGSGFAEADHVIHEKGKVPEDWWQMAIAPRGKEYLGYPTQKPEALLERIVRACSNEGDVVLDAYCGCGTTIAVAQTLKRKWIGIDITYHSISLVLRRLEKAFGAGVLATVCTDGIPRDMDSAKALTQKKDDRLRKEFEKWAVLTYTNNRAIVNEKKGADAGVDARAFFQTGKSDNARIIFQVKSGGVDRGDIAKLRGDMEREKAALGVFITLEKPSRPMEREAKAAGQYHHSAMARTYDRISIVTVREIIEEGKRLEIPMSLEVLAAARRAVDSEPLDLLAGI
jgi:site-specific DNA-methyltransferase (adenine-specific)